EEAGAGRLQPRRLPSASDLLEDLRTAADGARDVAGRPVDDLLRRLAHAQSVDQVRPGEEAQCPQAEAHAAIGDAHAAVTLPSRWIVVLPLRAVRTAKLPPSSANVARLGRRIGRRN